MHKTFIVIVPIFLFGAACPKPPVAAPAPVAPVELDGTRWWLRMHEGHKDERLIEIKRTGAEYHCTLASPGKFLSTLGHKPGETYCKIWRDPRDPSAYVGSYWKKMVDGSAKWLPVRFTTHGLILRWSESGSDEWERLP